MTLMEFLLALLGLVAVGFALWVLVLWMFAVALVGAVGNSIGEDSGD